MLVNKSIITTDFKPLSGTSTVTEAKNRMEMTEANSLPVVDTETLKLIGQVSYGQIRDADENKTIAELDLEEPVRVFRGQHIFEIARVMFQYEIRSIPVVDDEDIFLGMITKQLVLESLSKMLNLAEFGSVITVALDPIDFTISEIVQIIEREGAKILGVTVEFPAGQKQIFEVSFKLNLRDVTRVKSALSRYGYSVLAESESTVHGEELEHRADELLKYIDM
jgi:hypothetical protein